MEIKWEDYGESSLTLLAVHTRIDKAKPAVPQDPADFKRCVHLFECLNLDDYKIHDLLVMAGTMYPIWKPFISEWDGLMEIYIQEKDLKSAPRLYDAIRDITGN